MLKRLLLTLLLAAMGAVAWWIVQPRPPQDPGLVVHVLVVDQAGWPLENGQVEKVFEPGWKVVDADGRLRLTHVPLRVDEEPSAEALRRAVHVRAPYYSLRRGYEPEVEQRPDGAWAMRFWLHHHGVMRLHVRDSHLGRPKAWLEPDRPLQRWEAMDAGNVARPGAPAAYRIYPGLEHVVVRLTGEKDMHGTTGIATRRVFFEPPGPGHVVERTVTPDGVVPTPGTIILPEGPRPPTLRGRVRIVELSPGGRRIEHDPVPVEDDGSFVLRTLGRGRYELRATFDFLTSPEPLVVEAGDVVEWKGAKLGSWIEVRHPATNRAKRAMGIRCQNRDTNRYVDPLDFQPDATRTWFAIARDGPYRIRAFAEGSARSPPLDGECTVEVRGPGGEVAEPAMREVPSGTLVVHLEGLDELTPPAATVIANTRKATCISGVAEAAVFPNMSAGFHRHEVRVEWKDARIAPALLKVKVSESEESAIRVKPVLGGRLVLKGTGREAPSETAAFVLVLSREDDRDPLIVVTTCDRADSRPQWIARHLLVPGDHSVSVERRDADGDLVDTGVQLDFTIEAGRQTVVPFEVPKR